MGLARLADAVSAGIEGYARGSQVKAGLESAGFQREQHQWQREDRAKATQDRADLERHKAAIEQIHKDVQSSGGGIEDAVRRENEYKLANGLMSGLDGMKAEESLRQYQQSGVTNAIKAGMAGDGASVARVMGWDPATVKVGKNIDKATGTEYPVYTGTDRNGQPRGFDPVEQYEKLNLFELMAAQRKTKAEVEAFRAKEDYKQGQARELEGVKQNNRVALERTKAGLKSETEKTPTDVRVAQWYKDASPEDRAAFEEVKRITKDDKIAGQAVELMKADVTGKLTPQAAVQKVIGVEQAAAAARGQQPPGPAPAPAAPAGGAQFRYDPAQRKVVPVQ